MRILLHLIRTVRITSPELQLMAVQYTCHVISVCIMWKQYCTVIGWSYGDVIRTMRTIFNNIINNIYSKCKIKKIIIGANLRFSGSCGILQLLYKISCMNFRKNLTQFYIDFSRQENHINVLYKPFNAWDSQVSAFTSFHFSFTVPLSYDFN